MKRILSIFPIFLGLLSVSFAQKPNDKPADPFNSGLFSGLSFRSIGPAVTSGRISDFAVNPKKPSEYYVATASGGVWKTTNKGLTYQPIFDGQGSYSIGCISLDPNNPSTVWVGSGENNNQRSVAYGDGVYKSDDGGKSWNNMGLKNSEHISEIIVDPTDANTIYVGAYGPVWNEGGDRGVYKSTDGGATWNCVKSVSAYTGCNDLVMDPRNPKVLYAAFHQRMRKVFTYIGGGPETAIYKTTDGGATWKKLEGGLPSGDLGRMGLAISKVNPDVLYTVVEGQNDNGGVYRSMDKGSSWEKRSGFFTSGNYYQEIECDPLDVNKIYITDTYYKYSTDGGKTMVNLGEINKHIDNHCIWVDPTDGNHLLVGCDGGIYETYDFAKSWEFKSNLPVTQFYKVATDNSYPFYQVHGGTQDNFSLGGPSRTISMNGITNADWYVTSIGDGFETQVDQSNGDIIYAQSQYGGLSRFDKKSGEYLFIKPIEEAGEPALRWNWDAPLLISQFDNSRLYFGANKVFRTDDKGNSWKAISPDLTRQIDRNKLEVMGKVWSVDAIAKNGSTDIYGQTTTIAESKLDQNILWVGTDDGLIQHTIDGGKSWIKIDNISGAPSQSYVHQIIASLYDKNTAYACFNHHRYGDFKPYIFKTTDGGKSWKAIQNNLPTRGSVYSIAEDHVDPNLLFVGTEFGCYFSNNGGENWIQLKGGLPTIAVRDIEIQRRENDLVIATFGRGFYILDDYSALRNFKKDDINSVAKILPIKEGLMYIESMPLGLRNKGHMGSGYYNATNPKPGAVFTYYLKDDLKKIKDIRKESEKAKFDKNEKVYYPSLDSLRMEDNQPDPYLLFTIMDDKGEIVRHIKAPAKKGLQRILWNFRTNPASPVHQRYTPAPDQLFGSEELGHLVLPGKYSVILQKFQDGILTNIAGPVQFSCKLLQNSTLPATNPEANNEFYEKLTNLRKEISAVEDVVANMDNRLKNINAALLDMPSSPTDLLKRAYDLNNQLDNATIILFGDNSKSKREFESNTSVSDRIYGAIYSLWNSTSNIPTTYNTSINTASAQLKSSLAKLKSIYENIQSIEKELDMKNAPFSPGRLPKW